MSRAEKLRRRKRRKERNGHRPRHPFTATGSIPPIVHLTSYRISFDALNDELQPQANEPELDAALGDSRYELHRQVSECPAEAIPRLRELLVRFPESPRLMNWLAAASARINDGDEFERLARRNWELHPDYLFARCNYAQMLLRLGKIEEAAAVMNHQWDLKLMYPHRDIFHISEFLSFNAVAVEYFVRTGNFEPAQVLFDAIMEVAPNNEVTRYLRRIVEQQQLLLLAKQLSDDMLRRGRLPL